jgi:LysM repeat protein
MKTIGIKLADGSFYPVLEDNTPSEKQLELTTAHNNQTKVMVDLYRSATCSMEDAEYVDSLQIENLVAHPNGEAEIKFTVSLDEDNQLSAKIIDSETGNESNTTITLVSRTLEERLVTDEYGINDTEENGSGAGALAAGALAAGGLLAAAAAMRDKDSGEETEESDAREDEVETVEEDAPVEDESFVEEPVVVEETVEERSDDMPVEETSENLDDMNFDLPDDTSSEDITTESESLNDMNFDLPDDTVSEDTSDETVADETITESSDEISFDDTTSDETITEETSSDDTIADETSSDELPDMDFDLPDDTTDSSEDENPQMPDDFFNTEETMKDQTFDSESPVSGGLNFDGLYDEETERGTPSQNDDDDVKKKTKVPVIICIICAIICILATVVVLFIIPSKYNLITKKHAKENAATVAIEEPAPQPEPVAEPEPEPEPAVPEAKEDEIVIIEKAEEVVPSQPPVAEEKPKDITYKIKWGDTLWDIADTYYKNPWRYKYIARYNGIKNPDYIISGTKIVIPAE